MIALLLRQIRFFKGLEGFGRNDGADPGEGLRIRREGCEGSVPGNGCRPVLVDHQAIVETGDPAGAVILDDRHVVVSPGDASRRKERCGEAEKKYGYGGCTSSRSPPGLQDLL